MNLFSSWVFNLPKNTDCTICRCSLNGPSLYHQEKGIDSYVVSGICQHSFHNECIKPWVAKNKLCPICSQKWDFLKENKSESTDDDLASCKNIDEFSSKKDKIYKYYMELKKNINKPNQNANDLLIIKSKNEIINKEEILPNYEFLNKEEFKDKILNKEAIINQTLSIINELKNNLDKEHFDISGNLQDIFIMEKVIEKEMGKVINKEIKKEMEHVIEKEMEKGFEKGFEKGMEKNKKINIVYKKTFPNFESSKEDKIPSINDSEKVFANNSDKKFVNDSDKMISIFQDSWSNSTKEYVKIPTKYVIKDMDKIEKTEKEDKDDLPNKKKKPNK